MSKKSVAGAFGSVAYEAGISISIEAPWPWLLLSVVATPWLLLSTADEGILLDDEGMSIRGGGGFFDAGGLGLTTV